MTTRRILLQGAAASLVSGGAKAANGVRAISGDRFTMHGAEYQLADIRAPSIYTFKDQPEPHFDAARQALERVLREGPIDVQDVGSRTRWGVQPVHATRGAAASVQAFLVSAGAARVAPTTTAFDLIDRLLDAERKARRGAAGIWAHSAYQIFNAQKASGAVGAFQIVQGRVVSAARTRSRLYLNFGEDYKTDFTASIRARDADRWAKIGFDPSTLAGAVIRVRGYVEWINGPAIAVQHRSAIEIVS